MRRRSWRRCCIRCLKTQAGAVEGPTTHPNSRAAIETEDARREPTPIPRNTSTMRSAADDRDCRPFHPSNPRQCLLSSTDQRLWGSSKRQTAPLTRRVPIPPHHTGGSDRPAGSREQRTGARVGVGQTGRGLNAAVSFGIAVDLSGNSSVTGGFQGLARCSRNHEARVCDRQRLRLQQGFRTVQTVFCCTRCCGLESRAPANRPGLQRFPLSVPQGAIVKLRCSLAFAGGDRIIRRDEESQR